MKNLRRRLLGTHERIITDAYEYISEIEFMLKGVEFPIRAKIYKYLNNEEYGVRFNYRIKTPLQDKLWISTGARHSLIDDAIKNEIDSYVQHFYNALDEGLKPEAGWFQENPDY